MACFGPLLSLRCASPPAGPQTPCFVSPQPLRIESYEKHLPGVVCHSNWDKIINEASGGTNVGLGVAGAERRVSEVP